MGFAWSFSRYKNYIACPKRHYEVDIAKRYKEDKTPALLWGDQVHAAFKERLGTNKPFPEDMREFEKPAAEFLGYPGKLLVEHKFAITRGFTPTGYFDNDVWLRVNCDAAKINPPWAAAWDWKTGNLPHKKDAPEVEGVQLGLTAAVIFAHYPDVNVVSSDYRWLKEGTEVKTRSGYTRYGLENKKLWSTVMPHVQKMEHSFVTKDYPPKPSGLCKNYCPVQSCPFWKKGA